MAATTKAKKDGHPQGTKVTKSVVHGRQTVRAKAAPASTAKKAKPTTKAETNGSVSLRSRGLSAADTIVVVTKKNPYRDGSKRAKRFITLKNGRTVAEILESQKGLDPQAKRIRRGRRFIRKAVQAGHIRIERAKTAASKEAATA